MLLKLLSKIHLIKVTFGAFRFDKDVVNQVSTALLTEKKQKKSKVDATLLSACFMHCVPTTPPLPISSPLAYFMDVGCDVEKCQGISHSPSHVHIC